jgi:O-antigen/teichoic acid export membrane protein
LGIAVVVVRSQRSRIRTNPIDGRRGAVLTLADQLVSSASNFALGVLVARAGGASALGAFGIAFLVWLAVLGANRALVCEPMTVVGSTGSDTDPSEGCLASLVLGLAVAVPLAAVAAVLLLVGFNPAIALLALAPWIPSLLVQDYYRSMSFRLQQPDQALISDVLFTVAQGAVTAALLALHVTNVSAFLASWGLGATVGAWKGIALSGLRKPLRRGAVHFRELWPQSRWFLGEFATAFTAVQGYLLLLPLLLGTAEFGQYRAGASLIGPVIVIFVAGGNVGLPGCVRRLRDEGIRGLDKYTVRLTAAVVLLTVPYCAAVAVFAAPILRLVYGEPFTGAATVTQLIALDYAITTVGFGCNAALKATNQMKRLWATRAVIAVVSLITTIVLVNSFGLVGAGWASVVAGGAYAAGVMFGYQRMRKIPLTDTSEGRHC